MKKMSLEEMSMVTGGKTKKCRCGKKCNSWFSWNYHMLGKKSFIDCLSYVLTHSW